MSVTLVHPVREASAMGATHGTNAAAWAFNGNTSDQTYRAFLAGWEEGDPMVMDYYDPGAPLSGEWADGLTIGALAKSVGLDQRDDADRVEEVSDAYELAFSDAYWAELQRVAILHTSD